MHKALIQELGTAFTQVQRYTLTEQEVEAVYLCLLRLEHLEQGDSAAVDVAEEDFRRHLNEAVNMSCACGGLPDNDPQACPACMTWHRFKAATA